MTPRTRLSRPAASAEQAYLQAMAVVPRRRTSLALALLCASIAAALTAAPALALKTHLFSTSFGASGSGAGQLALVSTDYSFQNPAGLLAGSGIAVNSTTHDVYVADTGNHRVDQFSSSGAFIRAWGWGVADGSAALQTCTVTCQAGISGAGPGQFESPLSVAIDNSGGPSNGDVYVADTTSVAGPGTDLVQKFDSSGNLIATWANGGQLDGSTATGGPFSGELAGIAVDASGNLFVNNLNQNVFEFAPDGTPGPTVPVPGAEFPSGLATDSSGNLYRAANGNGQIDRLDSAGNNLGGIDRLLQLQEPGYTYISTGFAVDTSTAPFGDLYSDHASLISHYAVDASGSVIEPDGSLCPVVPGEIYGNCDPNDSFGRGSLSGAAGLAVDPATHIVYAADAGDNRVAVFAPGILADVATNPASNTQKTTAILNGHLDPDGGTPVTDCHFDYVTDAAFQAAGFTDLSSGGSVPCAEATPFSAPADVHADLTGLTAATTYRFRIVVSNGFGPTVSSDQPFTTLDAVTALSTGSATNVTDTGADLSGSYSGDGNDTHYYFQYGTSASYGHIAPALPGADNGSGTGPQTPSPISIGGLVPGTTYHYRIAAANALGTTFGADATFTTSQPPTIDAFSSANVTADSADLGAQINPQGFDTTYHFEYGITTGYGQSAPLTEADAGSGTTDQSVLVHISGLQDTVYHFRLLATNRWGTTASADQTFEFSPPSCPNAAVRQQTGAAYLPDCRGYELVSPGDANATLLTSGGPNPGTATSPSRFSFVGQFSSLPGAGDTINTGGDLYVATRTDSGWVSKYIGLPGNQTSCMSGPPNHPWSRSSYPTQFQNFVLTDPGMDRFLNWDDGDATLCVLNGDGSGDSNWVLDPASNAPYLWGADGSLLAHLPTDLASTPGAAAAFTCPFSSSNGVTPSCSGDVTASGDLSHLALSADRNSPAFAPGALTAAPGSAYDNDLAANTVNLISKTPAGADIPQDSFPPVVVGGVLLPGSDSQFIRFPAVSADGSHILMSTATATTPSCGLRAAAGEVCSRFTDNPIHLYMRVNDALTYDVSAGHAVNYLGMTPDASKVYFTSDQQLTPDDTDTSTDLYMWSEATDSLTRLSAASGGAPIGAGNSDSCNASWTAACGVVPYSGWSYAEGFGGVGGNGVSDGAIASQNGDVYFYSPEQLDGDHGVAGQQNLYDYRNARAQYVTTLTPGSFCQPSFVFTACTDGPIARLQVTPDDTHMAFLTASRLTSYDNAGRLEMYSYTPSTGAIVCDSCRPDGQPPSSDVHASQDGLFMTNDGRTFFSTTESLVPQDTNQGIDVYEFVDGRPQLITPGTGTAAATGVSAVPAGLVGVSADGTDAYFSTYDSLISADHNGSFLKFYDARTNGGFPEPPPAPPCAAAEECRGPGSLPPALPTQGSAASLTGGNATSHPRRRHHKKHHKKATAKRHHARHAKTNRGAAR